MEKYSFEKIDEKEFHVWHKEGNVNTFIASTDTAEKAHSIAYHMNQPLPDALPSQPSGEAGDGIDEAAVKGVVLNCWSALTDEDYPEAKEATINKELFIQEASQMVEGAIAMTRFNMRATTPPLAENQEGQEEPHPDTLEKYRLIEMVDGLNELYGEMKKENSKLKKQLKSKKHGS